VDFLNRIDRFLSGRLAWFSLGAMALSIAFPAVFSRLSPLTFGLFAFVTFASSLGGGFTQVGQVLFRPLPILCVFALQHAVLPLIALCLGRLAFPGDPDFVTGLVLQCAIPSAVMSLMWVAVSGGNTVLSLVIVLLDTLLSPVVIPLTLKLLLGSTVEMDGVGIMVNLLVMVALPAFLAMCCHQFSHGRVSKTVQPVLAPFSKLALILVMLANTAGVADYIRHMTRRLLLVVFLGLLIMVIGFLAAFLAVLLLRPSYPDGVCILLNTGLRNVNVGVVLAVTYFSTDVLFPVIVCAMSMHVLAATSVALFRRTKYARSAAGREFPAARS